PVPLNVMEEPEHIVDDGDTIPPTGGNDKTVTVIVLVAMQLPVVPVTVYVAVDDGTKAIPFVTPPDQLYEAAPDPLNVTVEPEQTVEAGDAVDSTSRKGFTVKVIVAVLLHPLAFVPVTVYVFVAAGINATPSVIPSDQL